MTTGTSHPRKALPKPDETPPQAKLLQTNSQTKLLYAIIYRLIFKLSHLAPPARTVQPAQALSPAKESKFQKQRQRVTEALPCCVSRETILWVRWGSGCIDLGALSSFGCPSGVHDCRAQRSTLFWVCSLEMLVLFVFSNAA